MFSTAMEKFSSEQTSARALFTLHLCKIEETGILKSISNLFSDGNCNQDILSAQNYFISYYELV
jgi:hypothetical protein